MNMIFLASAASAATGGGFLMGLALFCITLALFLFPFVVMFRLAKIIKSLEKFRENQDASSNAQTEQLKRQNALSRQLLRAYGHEPEA